MSDMKTQNVDEQLFDIDDSDASADGESTTDEQSSDSLDEEIEEDQLDLDDSKKSTSQSSEAKKQREKQIDVWYNRVSTGEVDINELPENLKWVKPHILQRLDLQKKTPDIREAVRKEMEKERATQRYELLKESLQSIKLTALQKKELQSEFKDLREGGMSLDKALDKAMRIAGIDVVQKAAEDLKQDMRMPAAARKSSGEKSKEEFLSDFESYKELPEQERLKRMQELASRPL